MRPIRFRAWAKVLNDGTMEMLDWDHYGKSIGEWLAYPPSDVIFMQFTGLKDKNGKEIYEGDIVRDSKLKTATIVLNRMVGFEDGTFGFLASNGGVMTIPKDWIVIGNIYENADLLTPSPAGSGKGEA